MEKITGVERGKYLYKLADLVEQQRDLLGAMEAWDSGKLNLQMLFSMLMNVLLLLDMRHHGLIKSRAK